MASNYRSSQPAADTLDYKESTEGACPSEGSEAGCQETGPEQQSLNTSTNRDRTDVVSSGYGGSSKSPPNSSQRLENNSPNSEELRLDHLPSELILHICSFLHAKVVIHSLSLVCKSLHSLLSDRMFWKVRLAKRWPKKYPAIPGEES